MEALFAIWNSFSPILRLVICLVLLSSILPISTYIFTTLRYRLSLRAHLSQNTKSTPLLPPTIPYAIPILGSALAFLAPYPGIFWSKLFASHPKETGVCTLQLGGQTTHVLFDHTAITALFKARGLNRERFNLQLSRSGLGAGIDDTRRFWGHGETKHVARQAQEAVVQRWLMKTERVGELSEEFTRQFRKVLRGSTEDEEERITGIASWVKSRMFNASVKTLMGERLFEIYPEITQDWAGYDEAIMSLFCGIPRFVIPEKYSARARVLCGLSRYHERVREECKGTIADPEEVLWEPLYGSRYNRARQIYYEEQGLSVHGKAAMDGGTLFGLASNPPPAVGWVLIHVFNPRGDSTLYPRLMKELGSAQKDNGSLDCRLLFGLPLLQSILHEVLRLYADTLVVRDMDADLKLPLCDATKQVFLPKDTTVMVPSWVAQYDEYWTRDIIPANKFHAERFLKQDPESGKEIFSLGGTNGRLFPFGAGHEICPGRVFAKQMMMIAIATILLEYDVEPLSFVDACSQECDKFPGFEKEYAGAGVVKQDGDLKVGLKRRKP